MTTMPHLAPLAAALHTQHGVEHRERNPIIGQDSDVCDLDAAELLTLMSSGSIQDWCGHHDEITEQDDEITRLRAALAKLVEAASTPPPMQAHDWSILQGALKEARLALAGS
jgi:hypothetical protein